MQVFSKIFSKIFGILNLKEQSRQLRRKVGNKYYTTLHFEI